MNVRCHTGDVVVARKQIEGMDTPLVPAGARGTVVSTTLLGKPKEVFFAVSDGWGLKRFNVTVRGGDVGPAPDDAVHEPDRASQEC